MTLETYIPSAVHFEGRALGEVFALVLYDPDGDAPHGAMTTHSPLAEGARGTLEATGQREGRTWRVTLGDIEVCRQTAVGCEFTIFGPVARLPL